MAFDHPTREGTTLPIAEERLCVTRGSYQKRRSYRVHYGCARPDLEPQWAYRLIAPEGLRNRPNRSVADDCYELAQNRACHRARVDTLERRYDASGPHLAAGRCRTEPCSR